MLKLTTVYYSFVFKYKILAVYLTDEQIVQHRGAKLVTTVTDTTISIVRDPAIAGSFNFLMILTLAILFVIRDLFSGAQHTSGNALRQVLRIAIVPLLMIFLLFVSLRISEISR
jgi:hypothetical protein